MMRSHLGEIGSSDDFGRVVESRAMSLLPVDVVMADGGWRVLEFENSRVIHHELDAPEYFLGRAKLKKIMGSLWPH